MDFTTHRRLPTSQADSSGTTTWVTSASVATVVTVLCRVDDYFASQATLVLVKIQPSLNLAKIRILKTLSILHVLLRSTLSIFSCVINQDYRMLLNYACLFAHVQGNILF